MGFSCECGDADTFFFRQRLQRARKPHKCCECGYEIAPGESYEVAAGMTEGYFWSAATCERCADLRDSFEGLGFCVSFGGGLFDNYADWLDEGNQTRRDADGDLERGRETAWRIREKHRDWIAQDKAP